MRFAWIDNLAMVLMLVMLSMSMVTKVSSFCAGGLS